MRSFKLQDPGEGIHEAEILEVRVSEGEKVSEGDIVLVIETDKAAVEIPSPFDGVVEQVAVAEGDVVEVGAELLRFDVEDDGQDGEDGDSRAADGNEPSATREESEDAEEDEEDEAADEVEADADEVDADEVDAEADEADADDPEGARDSRKTAPVLASPAARRLAREAGLTLASVDGTGPDGRVLAEDVRRAAQDGDRGDDGEPTDDSDEQRVPLRSVRRTIARRMQRAWQEIPHVTHTVQADITELSRFRKARRGDFPHLTLNVLILKALSAALRRHPRFNARLDGDEIVVSHRHHFGIAVDTDRGLLVPVVRDVDRHSMRSLASELEQVVNRARGGTLQAAEMRGGTFTVTNVGNTGASHFTPIINPPQAAILGVASAELRQVAEVMEDADTEPRWRARTMLPLILAFDHRLNDGMDAARFMTSLADALSSPESLLAAL